jgi:fibronectin type III domain protein
MKKWSRIVLLVALICLAGFARQSFAGSACLLTLEWEPSPDSEVAGYALYYGATDAPITNRLDVGLQTATVLTDLTASVEYAFYVVAYDADQVESEPSDPLFYTAQAISSLRLSRSSDGDISISFLVAPDAVCWVEYTDSLTLPNWNLLTVAIGDSNGDVIIDDPIVQPSRYYRAMVQQ